MLSGAHARGGGLGPVDARWCVPADRVSATRMIRALTVPTFVLSFRADQRRSACYHRNDFIP